MSALGESVSFGRFLSEPLEWGKWSAFAHNRYQEEAARQARPGSVAQKKAMFEAHYARKRKMETDDATAGAEGGYEKVLAVEEANGAHSSTSSAAGSSCMTDEAATEQEVSGGGGSGCAVDDAVECGGDASDGVAAVAADEVEVITDVVGSARKEDESVGETGNRESDASQSNKENQDLCTGHSVSVHAVEERQPLQVITDQDCSIEIILYHNVELNCYLNRQLLTTFNMCVLQECSIVNQDISTDSAKKRRLQMLSLFQKPAKLRSPSSGKKGQSSSAKRRSALHLSSKENASPPSTDSSKRAPTSVTKKRSTQAALLMSISFSRCETGSAASTSRNIGTTIAERISQLQSASMPAENTEPEFRPPRKVQIRPFLGSVTFDLSFFFKTGGSQFHNSFAL